MARTSEKSGRWLKRIIVALIAAIVGLAVSKRVVQAPSGSRSEYKLPPVPDVPPAGPEEATPLTEDEQMSFAARRSEAAGESGDVAGAIEDAGQAAPNGATEAGTGQAGQAGSVPPPISYEAAKKAAEEAEAARATGTEEGRKLGDAIDQRMYFGAAPAGQAPAEPAGEVASVENAEAEIADAGDERAGESTAPAPTGAPARRSGDTAPDATSEGYDVSDGADHTGRTPVEREDPTDVGLDIDVDLDDDEASAPDITSEGLDTGSGAGVRAGAAASGELTSGEGYVRLTGDARDCPEDYPIKGNASSRIFHKPGESSYDATVPEICFATPEVAESMGFRPRKR